MEKVYLGGQKLNGPPAAAAVNAVLKAKDVEAE